ncbi:unnamed protein product [Urochloa humidicola]
MLRNAFTTTTDDFVTHFDRLTFLDASHANTLVASGKWEELEKYLAGFIPQHESEEADKVHPGLLIIPREEQLLQMISEEKFDEAAIFFKMSIEPLKECKSDYRQFDLDWHVDDLAKITRQRSPHVKRASTKEVQNAIFDYFRLYFPNAVRLKYQDNENSLWQFTVVLEDPQMASEPKVPKSSSSSRPSYRCIACQWIAVDQSIATMRYHFAHIKSRKACLKITQHLINRLNTLRVWNDVFPDLATLVARGNKKRKQLPPASAAARAVHSVDTAVVVETAGSMFQEAAIPAVGSVHTAVVVETAGSMFEEAAIPAMGSVDAACQIDTVGARIQKVEAAEAINKSLLDLFDSDASGLDCNMIVEKLRKQKAILKELKSDCFSSSLEHHLPAQSMELPPAQSMELPPATELFLPTSSDKSGDFENVFSGLEDVFPDEDLGEAESMMVLQNICIQAIPEEQFDQLNDAE